MRGKVILMDDAHEKVGITPAYAGKRITVYRPPCLKKDYPRVCGEKLLLLPAGQGFRGLPPRMRGKVQICCKKCKHKRITPAYAGKSQSVKVFRPGNWDYPRVCGEKVVPAPKPPLPQGLPPRMRGKALADLPVDFKQRITPAYAGKSNPDSPRAFARADYPRVCGEK